MVEGLSLINYKGKTIVYGNYTNVGDSREKTIQLIKGITDEYLKYKEPKTILALTNVTNLHFDMPILTLFKEANNKCDKLYKKLAIVGVKGLIKAAYNFVIGLTNSYTKLFDSEEKAKEWLISD